jgi:hypothetical protein
MNKRLAFIAVVSLSVSAACGLLAVLATAWVGDEKSILGRDDTNLRRDAVGEKIRLPSRDRTR